MERIIGVGTDIESIREFKNACMRCGEPFLKKVFSSRELGIAEKMTAPRRMEFLAGRFAAKEAVMKAAGRTKSLFFDNVEILKGKHGEPLATLRSTPAIRIAGLKGCRCHLSISHSRDYAISIALLVKDGR